MSTCNSFFNLSKKTEGHRTTSRGFNLLLREIEVSILRGQEAPKRQFVDFIESINDQFTKLLEDAPNLNAGALAILNAQRKNKPSPFNNLRGITDDNRDDDDDFTEKRETVIEVNEDDIVETATT